MKENKVILITMVLNFTVAIIKLCAGIIFNFSSMIADSVQSFLDFITDITSLFANKIGMKRANKVYPFGYGQVYYLTNLLTGTLLFLIGMFILYQVFFFGGKFVPTRNLYIVLVSTLALKFIVVYLLRHYARVLKSDLLMDSAKESGADFLSTCVVLLISFLVLFEKYLPDFISIDKIGSFGMALYVFNIAIEIMVSNIRGVLFNTEENEELQKKISAEVEKIDNISLGNIKLVRMSRYYSVFIKVKVNENMKIKDYVEVEKQLKKRLKAKEKEIRFVDVEPSL